MKMMQVMLVTRHCIFDIIIVTCAHLKGSRYRYRATRYHHRMSRRGTEDLPLHQVVQRYPSKAQKLPQSTFKVPPDTSRFLQFFLGKGEGAEVQFIPTKSTPGTFARPELRSPTTEVSGPAFVLAEQFGKARGRWRVLDLADVVCFGGTYVKTEGHKVFFLGCYVWFLVF